MKATAEPPATVDEYIAAFAPPVQRVLREVRRSIRKAVPETDESISYKIPTYKLHGRPVIYFAGLKQHYSVYPANLRLVAAFKRELTPYDFNGKGTIRFPLNESVPSELLGRIARFLANEVGSLEEARTAAKKRSAPAARTPR